jgi:flavin reductase (DIM6/NTAB) family NADH-FMN oxidoreductase RutF
VGVTHTVIEPGDLEPAEVYKLVTGIVVPRPIAWITSIDTAGRVNLAPFSAFTMVSNDPPMVGVNIGLRSGEHKDTGRNILETGEYVVNIPDWSMRNEVHESGRERPPGFDEAQHLGLRTIASDLVAAPRLALAPVSLECRLSRQVEFGRAGARFTVGEIVRFHVRNDLLQGGKIDTRTLDPLLRLGGPNYARIGETETLLPISIGVSTRAERVTAGPT